MDDCRPSKKRRGSSDLLVTTNVRFHLESGHSIEPGTSERQSSLRRSPLRLAYNSQDATRFVRPVFAREKSGSCGNHLPRCLHRDVCPVATIDRFEQRYNDVHVLVVIRIISHTATACARGFVAGNLQNERVSGHRILQRTCLLLAQSRHDGLRRTRPLSGVKRTSPFCGAHVCFCGRYWG